jgi:four helix bundle protein
MTLAVPSPSRRRKRYHGLLAFRACDRVVLAVYAGVLSWPKYELYELYGLSQQARRFAFSTAANIAEGAGKRGYREFRRFLDISLGSLSELSYILSLAVRLGYLTEDEFNTLDDLLEEAGRLTYSLARSIDKKGTRPQKTRSPGKLPVE